MMVDGFIFRRDSKTDHRVKHLFEPYTGLSRCMDGLVDTGDINGDGHAEMVAGAPGMDDERGWVLIWDGSDVAQRGDLYPDFRIQGAQAGDRFGHRTRLEDLDGDGYLDLIVGAPTQPAIESDSLGSVYVLKDVPHSNWRPFMDTCAISPRSQSKWMASGLEGQW